MPRQMVWHKVDAVGTFPYKAGRLPTHSGSPKSSRPALSPLRLPGMRGPILGEGVCAGGIPACCQERMCFIVWDCTSLLLMSSQGVI